MKLNKINLQNVRDKQGLKEKGKRNKDATTPILCVPRQDF